MSKIEDSLLWDKFLSGDDKAYECIFNKYTQALFMFGLQYVSDREMIKDCIQELFIKIYRNRLRLSPTNNLKLYLYIALKNTLLNELKSQKRMSTWIDEIHPDTFSDNNIEENYIQAEENKIQSTELQKKLEALSPKQRKVLYYRFSECLSIAEIQDLMGINYQSTVNLIHRALNKLRDVSK